MSAYSTGRVEGERQSQLMTLVTLTALGEPDVVREVVVGWAHDVLWDDSLFDEPFFGLSDLLRAAYDCGPPVDAENLWEMAR